MNNRRLGFITWGALHPSALNIICLISSPDVCACVSPNLPRTSATHIATQVCEFVVSVCYSHLLCKNDSVQTSFEPKLNVFITCVWHTHIHTHAHTHMCTSVTLICHAHLVSEWVVVLCVCVCVLVFEWILFYTLSEMCLEFWKQRHWPQDWEAFKEFLHYWLRNNLHTVVEMVICYLVLEIRTICCRRSMYYFLVIRTICCRRSMY